MRTFLIILFLTAFNYCYAQLSINPYLNSGFGSDISSSVSVGTSFGNGFTTSYIAPNIYQTIGQKLTLNYGAVLSTGSGNAFIYNDLGYGQIVPSNSNTFYVNGTYQISERLAVKSTIVVENSDYSGVGNDMNNFNSNMVMMGLEYKISDNVRLQAEIGMQQGFHPYSYLLNPNNTYYMQHGISPFYRPFVGY
jgi:hypothetical protein